MTILLSMNNSLPLLVAACISLTACERASYTSWSCKNFEGVKLTMVLQKAQMQLQDRKLDYCGSLGNTSYFDATCPAQIENANVVFVIANGRLSSGGQNYQCDAL